LRMAHVLEAVLRFTQPRSFNRELHRRVPVQLFSSRGGYQE
jgi:hypothetical protein